jgi:hypothetical protein
MHAYSLAEWIGFATAEVGAAAALTGLLFVAVSINLSRILALPKLPARAAETLVVLLLALVAASLVLLPQNVRLLGTEVGALGLGSVPSPSPCRSATAQTVRTIRGRGTPAGSAPRSFPRSATCSAGSPVPSAGAAACTGSPPPPSSPSSAPSTTPGFSSSRSSANSPSLRPCQRTSGDAADRRLRRPVSRRHRARL